MISETYKTKRMRFRVGGHIVLNLARCLGKKTNIIYLCLINCVLTSLGQRGTKEMIFECAMLLFLLLLAIQCLIIIRLYEIPLVRGLVR